MVKFTFVSVFLILTAMSALVFAAPTDLAKYSVRIRGTDYFLLSDVPNGLVSLSAWLQGATSIQPYESL